MTDTTFFGGIKVASARFWLDEPMEMARLGDGSVIKGSLGEALWQGEAQLPPAYHHNAAATEALLAKLQRAGEFMLAYDTRFNGPIADPGGAILGAATPVLHTVDGDNKRIRISGLPPAYVISPGDYIGWMYSNRYAVHRAVTGATASGAGLTPLFEVTPFIRPGFVTGTTAVVLVRPPIKAVLLDPQYGSGAPLITQGASFGFIQTLR